MYFDKASIKIDLFWHSCSMEILGYPKFPKEDTLANLFWIWNIIINYVISTTVILFLVKYNNKRKVIWLD